MRKRPESIRASRNVAKAYRTLITVAGINNQSRKIQSSIDQTKEIYPDEVKIL